MMIKNDATSNFDNSMTNQSNFDNPNNIMLKNEQSSNFDSSNPSMQSNIGANHPMNSLNNPLGNVIKQVFHL